jgi:peptidoglycan/xylan/chitin deacetylase (PgdA/CDA1 family)
MYHYVRDRNRMRYPRINALDTAEFDGQLDYIARNYTVISLSEALSGLRDGMVLPDNACVLTFDDGLLDHFEVVYPRLRAKGWSGAFFPIAETTWKPVVADVHKIHYIMASEPDEQVLYRSVLGHLKDLRASFVLPKTEDLISEWGHASRFDTAEAIFVKRMMQTALNEAPRRALVDRLFEAFVRDDEALLNRETYLDATQIREMARGGMEIGGHGDTHLWLGQTKEPLLTRELDNCTAFLKQVSGRDEGWVMCYPSGSYSDAVINGLKSRGFSGGLTTEVRLATSQDSPFTLPRIDTRDLPVCV